MSEISFPKEWWSIEYGDALISASNGIGGKQNKAGIGIPVSRIETIANETINFERVGYLEAYDPDKILKHQLCKGDILFSHINSPAHLGKTALFDSDKELYHGINLLRLIVDHKLFVPRLFNYHCRLLRNLGIFSQNAQHAVNQSSLNQKKLFQFSAPLPPLAEQKVIADKLDTLLAQVESTKARLERIPQILKRFRQSVLAAAVSGRLTEEWRRHLRLPNPTDGKLSDCIESMVGGASPKTSDYSDTGMLALNKGDIKEYGCIEGKRNPKYVPLEFVENNSKKVIRDGTIVVTLRDLSQKADFLGLIGRYRGQEPALITQGMYGLKVNPRVAIKDYLIAFSNAPQYRTQVKKEKVGATQVHLRNGQFLDIAVPLFVIEEQTEIVRRIDQLFAHADRIEQQVNNALVRVNNLTQSILAKAFRGELTEQWRKDNPELISGENSAEALLERIKPERAVATKPKHRTSKT